MKLCNDTSSNQQNIQSQIFSAFFFIFHRMSGISSKPNKAAKSKKSINNADVAVVSKAASNQKASEMENNVSSHDTSKPPSVTTTIKDNTNDPAVDDAMTKVNNNSSRELSTSKDDMTRYVHLN